MKRKMQMFLMVLISMVVLSCSGSAEVEVTECDSLIVPNTELVLVNTSTDTALVYLTLSGYPAGDTLHVQDVNGIFGCTQTGLVGSFTMLPGDTLEYTSYKWFSGNITFGGQPINCPTTEFPTGVNLFEFNLNCEQESIDISAVGGVNSMMEVDLFDGPDWAASDAWPNVRHFYNDSMWHNTGLVGVFPYGCTNCTNTEGKQDCQSPTEVPNNSPICNPTRAAGVKGGIVMVTFTGFTN